MDRINSANVATINGRRGWKNKNLAAGTAGTIFDAAWFDDLQEELIAVIASRGITPTAGIQNQLLQGISALPFGTTRPATLILPGLWRKTIAGNTATEYLVYYDGTSDITLFTIDLVNHKYIPFGQPVQTISTAAPSGGVNGDIWFQV